MKKNILTLGKSIVCFALISVLAVFSACDDDDLSNNISRISVKQMPQVAYVLGSSLDFSNIVLTVERGDASSEVAFSDFDSQGFSIEPANGTTLNFDNQSVIITHTESGKGVTQPIDVTNNVVSIIVAGTPQTQFIQGETLDLTDVTIEATLEDGTLEMYPFADFGNAITSVPAHGDVLDVSNDAIVFTFESTGVEYTLDITTGEFMPVSGLVKSQLTTSTYNVGDRLDMDGLSIEYTFAGSNSMVIESADFDAYGIVATPAQNDKVGSTVTEIKLTHTESGTVVTVPLNVNSMTITGMTMTMKPNKTLYDEGELVDMTGIVILLTIDGIGDVEVSADDLYTYGIVTTPEVGQPVTSDLSEIVVSHPDYSESISISLGSEIMYESNFSAGIDGWEANAGSAQANLSVVDAGMLVSGIVLDGGSSWAPQIIHTNKLIEQGVKYKVTLTVTAVDGEGEFWLPFSVGDGTGAFGWGDYSPAEWGVWVPASGEVTFADTFVQGGATDTDGRICIKANGQTNSFVITYVKLEKL